MNQWITEWLTNEQLQNFDIDSIKDMIEENKEKIKNKEKEIKIDFDDQDSLTMEEIILYNKLKESWNIIKWLEEILAATQKVQWKKESDSWFLKTYYEYIWDEETVIQSKIEWKEDINEKKIEDYSVEEAVQVLELLNKNYNYYVNRNTLDTWSQTLGALDWKADTNIFQEKLIKIIIWSEWKFYDEEKIWYKNNWMIWDYENSKGWNRLIPFTEFFDTLEKTNDMTKINSKALASLLICLNNFDLLSIDSLVETLWVEKVKQLKKIWSDKSEFPQTAKKILQKLDLNEFVQKVVSVWDIVTKNPYELSLYNKNIPSKDEFKKLPILKIIEFNKKYSIDACPNFIDPNEALKKEESDRREKISQDKFNKILLITKEIEIEKNWENTFNISFQKILDKKLEKKWISKEKINLIKEKSNTFSKEVFKEWLKEIEKDSCWFLLSKFLVDKINPFLDKYDLENLNEEERKKLALNMAETNEKTDIEKLNILKNKLNDPFYKWNREQLKKQIEEIEKKLKKDKQIIITSQSSDKELNKFIEIIQNWWTKEDAFNDFIKTRAENKKEIIKEDNSNIQNKENNNNYFSPTEENYKLTEWWYKIEWKDWKPIEWLIISKEEKKITMWNPEATENLIHFYEFFKELNLESVWDYRKELMISMWNRNINFIDNDSLSKSELIQFWNNLILSLNNLVSNNKKIKEKPKLFITTSLSWLKNELRKFSWAWSVLSNEKTYDIKWEDRFAATLRNFWIIWWAYFKINLFRESIK